MDLGNTALAVHLKFRHLCIQNKGIIETLWAAFDRNKKREVILAASAVGDGSFLRSRDDNRSSLSGARALIPELNLDDLTRNDSYLFNLLQTRAALAPHESFPDDAEIICQATRAGRLRQPRARPHAFMNFFDPTAYGQTYEAADLSIAEDMVKIGNGLVQPENKGRLILNRQIMIYSSLFAIVESILEEKHSLETISVAPREILSEQPLPTEDKFKKILPWPSLPRPIKADESRLFIPAPPKAPPSQLFSVRPTLGHLSTAGIPDFLFVGTKDSSQVLFFIDGECIKPGTPEARAGCGVCYSTMQASSTSRISHPLENDGIEHTSNRAELRAALLALDLLNWKSLSFSSVVLACDSEYLVRCATELVEKWMSNGWKTKQRKQVQNRGMWEKLVEKIDAMEKDGVRVKFWKIPADWNEAARFAKEATAGFGPGRED